VTTLGILLSSNINKICSATPGKKFFLKVIEQENVNIAFDCLGCNPIDLAVLSPGIPSP